jgi:hypothetical protein
LCRGNGASSDGTFIASRAQSEASGDESVASNTGLVLWPRDERVA